MTLGEGSVTSAGHAKEGEPVDLDMETRINQLLDQLEDPKTSEAEIKRIKKKLEILRAQDD